MAEETEKEAAARKKAEETEKAKEAKKAAKKEWSPPPDPLIKVRVTNLDLVGNDEENIPWSFVHRRASVERPDGSQCRFKAVSYPLQDGKEYDLPEHVVVHLESIAYPVRKYKPNQPEGDSIPISGSRRRFTISRL